MLQSQCTSSLFSTLIGDYSTLNLSLIHARVISHLVENVFETSYTLDGGSGPVKVQNDTLFNRPFQQLLIYAILMDDKQLAQFFWQWGDNPVITALFATKLCDSLMHVAVGRSGAELIGYYREWKRFV
jgi:hypothetical protein